MSVLAAALTCPQCGAPLACRLTPRQSCPCEACGAITTLHLFPAVLEGDDAQTVPNRITDSEEATCFNHGDRKASVVCDGCGKFLCALCDIAWDERHLCSQCVAREHESADSPEGRRVFYRYDAMAVTLLGASLFMWFFSFLLYPAALVLIVQALRKPASVMPRGRGMLALAAFLAIGLPAAFITFFYIILEF